MILRICKIIATSVVLAASECTKFVFGRGSALDPAGGAYSAPPDPLAVVSDVVENVDSSSKSNLLRRRGKNYDASTWRRRRRRRKK